MGMQQVHSIHEAQDLTLPVPQKGRGGEGQLIGCLSGVHKALNSIRSNA